MSKREWDRQVTQPAEITLSKSLTNKQTVEGNVGFKQYFYYNMGKIALCLCVNGNNSVNNRRNMDTRKGIVGRRF